MLTGERGPVFSKKDPASRVTGRRARPKKRNQEKKDCFKGTLVDCQLSGEVTGASRREGGGHLGREKTEKAWQREKGKKRR